MSPGNGEHQPRAPRQLGGLDTYPVAQVEAFVEQIDALEAENKDLRARVAELEAREKQRAEDEAWANERFVLVEFHPVTSGWHAFALGVVKRFNAVAPTIHGALRALREKMEARL